MTLKITANLTLRPYPCYRLPFNKTYSILIYCLRDINTVTTMVTIIFLVTSTRLTLNMAQVGTVSSIVRLLVHSPVMPDSNQILESTVTTATQPPSLHGHLINSQPYASQAGFEFYFF